jgi:hypothetical protein
VTPVPVPHDTAATAPASATAPAATATATATTSLTVFCVLLLWPLWSLLSCCECWCATVSVRGWCVCMCCAPWPPLRLLQVSRRLADTLADPEEYPNLFPDLPLALWAEEIFKRQRYPLPPPPPDMAARCRCVCAGSTGELTHCWLFAGCSLAILILSPVPVAPGSWLV